MVVCVRTIPPSGFGRRSSSSPPQFARAAAGPGLFPPTGRGRFTFAGLCAPASSSSTGDLSGPPVAACSGLSGPPSAG